MTAQTPLYWFGDVGQGGDDTTVFQTALNATAQNGDTLEIPAGWYQIRPVYFPSNATVIVDAGARINAMPGFGPTDMLLNIIDAQNVSIFGTPGQSVFQMNRWEYGDGEYRHCLNIIGATGVNISGIQCNGSGGDGVYIGEGSQGFSAYISITNSGFDGNRRQGMSIISAQHVYVGNCTFTYTSGTAPSGGIDLEPNHACDVLQDIVIESSLVAANAGCGVSISLTALKQDSVPVSITVSNVTSEWNGESGFYTSSGHDDGSYTVPGSVFVVNSTSMNDAQYGAVSSYWDAGGASLTFQNLTVLNPNAWHNNIDNAAIAIKRGGGAVHPMGNIHFFGTSVVDWSGNIDTYCTVWDWSYIGITQVQFVDSSQLFGANWGTALVSGIPMNPIDLP